ncbi:unnamed protein product [Amoebophrya sp. A120]|nr:unnamed protein product [Amoebophrya sp. A120]|eukprot:GSA120T00025093001.1
MPPDKKTNNNNKRNKNQVRSTTTNGKKKPAASSASSSAKAAPAAPPVGGNAKNNNRSSSNSSSTGQPAKRGGQRAGASTSIKTSNERHEVDSTQQEVNIPNTTAVAASSSSGAPAAVSSARGRAKSAENVEMGLVEKNNTRGKTTMKRKNNNPGPAASSSSATSSGTSTSNNVLSMQAEQNDADNDSRNKKQKRATSVGTSAATGDKIKYYEKGQQLQSSGAEFLTEEEVDQMSEQDQVKWALQQSREQAKLAQMSEEEQVKWAKQESLRASESQPASNSGIGGSGSGGSKKSSSSASSSSTNHLGSGNNKTNLEKMSSHETKPSNVDVVVRQADDTSKQDHFVYKNFSSSRLHCGAKSLGSCSLHDKKDAVLCDSNWHELDGVGVVLVQFACDVDRGGNKNQVITTIPYHCVKNKPAVEWLEQVVVTVKWVRGSSGCNGTYHFFHYHEKTKPPISKAEAASGFYPAVWRNSEGFVFWADLETSIRRTQPDNLADLCTLADFWLSCDVEFSGGTGRLAKEHEFLDYIDRLRQSSHAGSFLSRPSSNIFNKADKNKTSPRSNSSSSFQPQRLIGKSSFLPPARIVSEKATASGTSSSSSSTGTGKKEPFKNNEGKQTATVSNFGGLDPSTNLLSSSKHMITAMTSAKAAKATAFGFGGRATSSSSASSHDLRHSVPELSVPRPAAVLRPLSGPGAAGDEEEHTEQGWRTSTATPGSCYVHLTPTTLGDPSSRKEDQATTLDEEDPSLKEEEVALTVLPNSKQPAFLHMKMQPASAGTGESKKPPSNTRISTRSLKVVTSSSSSSSPTYNKANADPTAAAFAGSHTTTASSAAQSRLSSYFPRERGLLEWWEDNNSSSSTSATSKNAPPVKRKPTLAYASALYGVRIFDPSSSVEKRLQDEAKNAYEVLMQRDELNERAKAFRKIREDIENLVYKYDPSQPNLAQNKNDCKLRVALAALSHKNKGLREAAEAHKKTGDRWIQRDLSSLVENKLKVWEVDVRRRNFSHFPSRLMDEYLDSRPARDPRKPVGDVDLPTRTHVCNKLRHFHESASTAFRGYPSLYERVQRARVANIRDHKLRTLLADGLVLAGDELAKLSSTFEELHSQCLQSFVDGAVVIDVYVRREAELQILGYTNAITVHKLLRDRALAQVDIFDNVVQKRLPEDVNGVIADFLYPTLVPSIPRNEPEKLTRPPRDQVELVVQQILRAKMYGGEPEEFALALDIDRHKKKQEMDKNFADFLEGKKRLTDLPSFSECGGKVADEFCKWRETFRKFENAAPRKQLRDQVETEKIDKECPFDWWLYWEYSSRRPSKSMPLGFLLSWRSKRDRSPTPQLRHRTVSSGTSINGNPAHTERAPRGTAVEYARMDVVQDINKVQLYTFLTSGEKRLRYVYEDYREEERKLRKLELDALWVIFRRIPPARKEAAFKNRVEPNVNCSKGYLTDDIYPVCKINVPDLELSCGFIASAGLFVMRIHTIGISIHVRAFFVKLL